LDGATKKSGAARADDRRRKKLLGRGIMRAIGVAGVGSILFLAVSAVLLSRCATHGSEPPPTTAATGATPAGTAALLPERQR
jgi:hypothetical protein